MTFTSVSDCCLRQQLTVSWQHIKYFDVGGKSTEVPSLCFMTEVSINAAYESGSLSIALVVCCECVGGVGVVASPIVKSFLRDKRRTWQFTEKYFEKNVPPFLEFDSHPT